MAKREKELPAKIMGGSYGGHFVSEDEWIKTCKNLQDRYMEGQRGEVEALWKKYDCGRMAKIFDGKPTIGKVIFKSKHSSYNRDYQLLYKLLKYSKKNNGLKSREERRIDRDYRDHLKRLSNLIKDVIRVHNKKNINSVTKIARHYGYDNYEEIDKLFEDFPLEVWKTWARDLYEMSKKKF